MKVVPGRAQQFDHGAGAQIGPSDAHHYQGVGIPADLRRRRFYPLELFPVEVPGQIDPAGEFAAGAVAFFQHVPGALQGIEAAIQPVFGQESLQIGQIEFEHGKHLLCRKNYTFSIAQKGKTLHAGIKKPGAEIFRARPW